MRRIAPLGGRAHRGMRYRLHKRRRKNRLPSFEECARFGVDNLLEIIRDNFPELERCGRIVTGSVVYERGADRFTLDGVTVVFKVWDHPRWRTKTRRILFNCPVCKSWRCRVLYRPRDRDWRCQSCWEKRGMLYRCERLSRRWRKADRRRESWRRMGHTGGRTVKPPTAEDSRRKVQEQLKREGWFQPEPEHPMVEAARRRLREAVPQVQRILREIREKRKGRGGKS